MTTEIWISKKLFSCTSIKNVQRYSDSQLQSANKQEIQNTRL